MGRGDTQTGRRSNKPTLGKYGKKYSGLTRARKSVEKKKYTEQLGLETIREETTRKT
jgi:hypothetical protein